MTQGKLSARAFNDVQVDRQRGILAKTSLNRNKLIDEINWYLKLPEPLHYLLPRIYEYSLDPDAPYVKMEYYGYRTLHELMVYEDLPDERWHEIFERLRFYIEDMKKFRVEDRRDDIHDAVGIMYIDKTIQRLDSIREYRAFRGFFERPIVVNGREYLSLDEIMTRLPTLVEELLMPDAEREFSIIHGDLCFPNILIEEIYHFMRLVDPRGSFGAFDIYGDSRYDLAKIFHSMEGRYDYIVDDRFTVEARDGRIKYRIKGSCARAWTIFNEVFESMLEGKRRAVRLIESTLFLSMIPLHSDVFERQLAMLATGVELFDKVLEGSD